MKLHKLEEIVVANYARQLFSQFGEKAIAIAAQRRQALEDRGECEKANNWRRIRLALSEMYGPALS